MTDPSQSACGEPLAPPPPRSARYLFCFVLLLLEAFVALFFALVLYGLRITDGQTAALIGGGVGALALASAGLMRTRAGLILGSATQLALLAAGVLLPDMILLGLIFAILWGLSVYLGTKIDRERSERHTAELAHLRASGSLE